LIVEHDMSVCWTGRPDFGAGVRQIICLGNAAEIRGNPKVKEAYLGEEAA